MSAIQGTILVVDDSVIDLKILIHHLEGIGYETVTAANGVEAWAALDQRPETFDAILLDRNMPMMGGIELLRRLKQDTRFKAIPVVIQTAAGEKYEIAEGIREGAYYYLVKPIKREILLPIVKAAIEEKRHYDCLKREIQKNLFALNFMVWGVFMFRTPEEGDQFASLIANLCPQPQKVVTGLSELFTNAVEHGNLDINYEKKTELITNGEWLTELNRLLILPEHGGKFVKVRIEQTPERIDFFIKDQGTGFKYEKYLNFDPARIFDNHGRGIAMATTFSFDRIRYIEPGNEVIATVKINRNQPEADACAVRIHSAQD